MRKTISINTYTNLLFSDISVYIWRHLIILFKSGYVKELLYLFISEYRICILFVQRCACYRHLLATRIVQFAALVIYFV